MVRIIVFLFALLCAQHGVCGRTVPKQTSRLVNPYVKADDREREAAAALLALSWWGQPVETAPTIKRIRI
ncbi:hypothetical protein EBR77_03820, partial [bacterium]|nr:hypothetical protein [bacterium]